MPLRPATALTQPAGRCEARRTHGSSTISAAAWTARSAPSRTTSLGCAPAALRPTCSIRSRSRPMARRCRSTRWRRSPCRSRACCRFRSGTSRWWARSTARSARPISASIRSSTGTTAAHPAAGTQRAAPQGTGQDRPQICRAGPGRRPPRAPRRHGPPQEGGKGRRASARTSSRVSTNRSRR